MPPFAAALSPAAETDVLGRLQTLCGKRGLDDLGERLQRLALLVQPDMQSVESSLLGLPSGAPCVQRGAQHLIRLGGKRLRPMCVALAARVGDGFGYDALELAVAVELIHAATLLHDDVVDLGEVRRGAPAARMLFGNAISIFSGDWLLIEALRRIHGARVQGTIERVLDTIEEMILAESLQLERRGNFAMDPQTWLRVVEGKTAALFRWAMFAGGAAGNLPVEQCLQLERYGTHLGVAFQATDDMLDVCGNEDALGKAVFADLREGKMTYPVILAAEQNPLLLPLLRQVADCDEDSAMRQELGQQILDILMRSGSLEVCRRLAEQRAQAAVVALHGLPSGPAIDALVTVADTIVDRDR